MTTFIGITDIHMAQRHTKYRPNVGDDLLAKVQFVVDRCNELDATLLCAGDWFHRADCSFGVVSALAKEFDRLEPHLHCVGITGQHDLPDHGDWEKGPVYSLSWKHMLGVDGEPGDHIWWAGDETEPAMLCLPYGTQVETEMLYPRCQVILVHEMLVPRPVPWDHVLLDDFEALIPKDGVERVVLSGDYHAGYPPTKINDTLFLNPGALARVTRDEADRQPQYVMFSVADGRIVPHAGYYPVPCRPGVEAFDMEGYGQEQAAPKTRAEFASMLQQVKEQVAAGAAPQLLLDSMELSADVRSALTEALSKAHSDLGYT